MTARGPSHLRRQASWPPVWQPVAWHHPERRFPRRAVPERLRPYGADGRVRAATIRPSTTTWPTRWWDPRGPFAMLHWLAAARGALVPPARGDGAVLVDLGCGPGCSAPHIAGKGYRHIGVDLTAVGAGAARAHGVTVGARRRHGRAAGRRLRRRRHGRGDPRTRHGSRRRRSSRRAGCCDQAGCC